jgi:hypothetical protein
MVRKYPHDNILSVGMVSNSQKFISDYYDDLDLPSDFAFVRAPSREPLRQSRTERSGARFFAPTLVAIFF